MRKSQAIASHLIIAACLGWAPVYAQAPDDGDRVGDIVVTAQRRQERLQDVPISVSVADAEALERVAATSVKDVMQLVPSLVISAGTGSVSTFLRGIGNPSNVAGNEASVPAYIDGVYYTHLSPALMELNNVERVEVLRGPQGTLFGRNSTGGLIQVITRRPSTDPALQWEIGYGNYNTVSATGYGTTGLGEDAAIDLSISYRDQEDGWGTNVATGEDVRWARHFLARSSFLLHASDSTDITLSVDYLNSLADQSTIAGQPYEGTTIGNPLALAPTIYPQLADFYDYNQDHPVREETEVYSFVGRIEHRLSFADLVSLTAYRNGDMSIDSDVDMTPVFYSSAIQINQYESISQELQLISNQDGPFEWTLGLYYLDSEDGYPQSYVWGPQFGGNGIMFSTNQVVESRAAYGQASYHLPTGTTLTAGLRYTSDDVEGSGRTDSVAPTSGALRPSFTTLASPPTASASTTFEKLTWRAAIDHQFSENAMIYGSVSTGFKAGLYNLLPFNATPLRPETITAYEVGLKTTSFDNRLRFNVSGFWYDESNVQVQQSIATGGVIAVFSTNAAKARVRGVDVEGEYRFTDDFSATFAASYVDSEYEDFPGSPSTVNQTALVSSGGTLFVPGCSTPAAGNLNPLNGGNVNNCGVDATGNRLPRAPELTANLGLNYHIDVGEGGGLDLAGNVSYNDGFFWLPDNKLKQDPYTLLNASVRYTFPGERYAIRLWGKNITGEEYYAYMSQFSGPSGSITVPAAPATYGVSLSASF